MIFIWEIYLEKELGNVEKILGHTFKKKAYLVQALSHKSYTDQHKQKNLGSYKLLQFLGNSILNFIVMDFYYQKSIPYSDDYNPRELHMFKKEIMTNLFLSLVFIENDLHHYVLIGPNKQYNALYNSYVKNVIESINKDQKASTDQNKCNRSTKGLFNLLITRDVQENFLDPRVMPQLEKRMEKKINENGVWREKITVEDLQSSFLEIFGDVFESLIGAVFLDSLGDLNETKRVIMKILEPYLYLYGGQSLEAQAHPRTTAIDTWANESMANIKDKPIKISHLSNNEKG